VADPVQAVRQRRWIVERARQVEGIGEEGACLLVLAAGPQEPKVQQSLPLGLAITRHPCGRQGGLVVGACQIEVAEPFVGQAARAMQAWRWRDCLPSRGFDSARVLL